MNRIRVIKTNDPASFVGHSPILDRVPFLRQEMKDAVRRIREPFRKINCPLANQLKLPVFSAKVKAKIVFEISGKERGGGEGEE